MTNVVQFIPKKPVVVLPTPAQLEEQQLQEENDFIDKFIEQYIVDAVSNFVDLEEAVLLEEGSDKSNKMIAFLRETLIATLHLLQGKEHPLHALADELVEFTDDPEIKEIELD